MSKTYGKKRTPRWRRTNRHHLIPRSRGGGDGENVIEIDERWHAALHMTFGCATPREYLLLASTDPEGFARRWVSSLVRHFGYAILEDLDV